MEYPRVVKLTDPKLLDLELKKAQFIEEGREISKKIEEIDLEMGKIDIRLQNEESKVDISDLKIKQGEISKQMDDGIKYFTDEIKKLQQQIFDRMSANTDPSLREQHKTLSKQKEELETERNKKALKAQKFKDRIIPLARKLLQPELKNKYEDFYDVKLVNGEMVGQIFSHLADFEQTFEKRLKDKYLTK